MNRSLPFVFVVFFSMNYVHSQNLVPNAGFEDTAGCPVHLGQVSKCTGWRTYSTSPDYFNECNKGSVNVPVNYWGNQNASNGHAYFGFCAFAKYYFNLNHRELFGCQLSNPLIIGKRYYVSMEVSLAEKSIFACNNLGFSFSTSSSGDDYGTTIINQNKPKYSSNSIIADYKNWVKIGGSFIADSNYKYIIIGNFKTDDLTQYQSMNSISATDSVAYYYVDNICVSLDSLTCPFTTSINMVTTSYNKLKPYPNPFFNSIKLSGLDRQLKQIVIYDAVGTEVANTSLRESLDWDLSTLPKGIYFFRLTNEFGYSETGKIIKE